VTFNYCAFTCSIAYVNTALNAVIIVTISTETIINTLSIVLFSFSMIDIDFNESRFGHLSDIFDEIFGKEISHNYNVLQTDKQIRILAEDIQEIRNILVSGTKKFDGNIKDGLSKITITIPPGANESDNDDNNNNKYYSFISSVSDIIYNSRIKIQDAFFTPREIVLVLNDKMPSRLMNYLRPTITK